MNKNLNKKHDYKIKQNYPKKISNGNVNIKRKENTH